MMTKNDLSKKIYEIAYLTGSFKLRSGKISNEYFDKYRFESNPELLKQIAVHMKPLIPPDTEVLAGLEMGGIPIATALSLESGIPCVFVRKEAKDYGTCQFAEGLEIKNKKILIIEDVITTGGQVVQSARDLKDHGASIENILCVIDRSQGDHSLLNHAGLHLRSLFTMDELKAHSSNQ